MLTAANRARILTSLPVLSVSVSIPACLSAKGKRPLLNGNFTFLAGFLDQSFWPDGIYTAPTDEGLASDVEAVPMFGLNMIRLHQKVNPERWYVVTWSYVRVRHHRHHASPQTDVGEFTTAQILASVQRH